MKKIIQLFMVLLSVGGILSSCNYREYADADYPENYVYQPMASVEGGIWYINSPDTEDAGLPTPGAPVKYYLDEERDKFIINMGVVQSGVKLKECTVDIDVDFSTVNTLIADGTFDPQTMGLPDFAYSLPESVNMGCDSDAVAFTLEISSNLFLTDEYAGKKFAIAVRIQCDEVAVNPDLDTVIICIDPAFLEL